MKRPKMKQLFLAGLALMLLPTAALAAPGDPVIRWNNDAGNPGRLIHGSRPVGTTPQATEPGSDQTAAAVPWTSNNPWLKRDNDARGPMGTPIHGSAPTGSSQAAQP